MTLNLWRSSYICGVIVTIFHGTPSRYKNFSPGLAHPRGFLISNDYNSTMSVMIMTQKLKKEKYLPFQTTHLLTKMNDFKIQHLIEVLLSALSKACALCSLWSVPDHTGCTSISTNCTSNLVSFACIVAQHYCYTKTYLKARPKLLRRPPKIRQLMERASKLHQARLWFLNKGM